MTEEGYFELKNNDDTKIVILKDGLYRVKCKLWCYCNNTYYTDCYLNIDGNRKDRSYFASNYTTTGNNAYAVHHFDIVFVLKKNQDISFQINTGTLNYHGDGDNYVHIEKL